MYSTVAEKNDSIPLVNVFYFIFLNIITFVLFLNNRNIFPTKYFNDNDYIKRLLSESVIELSDKSYAMTTKLFGFLGFTYNDFHAKEQFLGWMVFMLFLYYFLIIEKIEVLNIYNNIVLGFSIIAFSAYMAQISKDLILFFLMVIMIFVIHKIKLERNIYIFSIAIILIYSFNFRSYWYLILAFFLLNSVLVRLGKKKKLIILLNILLVCSISIYYNKVFNLNITYLRTSVNQYRVGSSDAATMIYNYFPDSGWQNDVLNYFYVLLNMVFPLDGLGSKSELIYYFWVYLFIIGIMKNKQNKQNKPLIILLTSFLLVQPFFEPDIGSMFRHQIAMLPIIFILSYQKGVDL